MKNWRIKLLGGKWGHRYAGYQLTLYENRTVFARITGGTLESLRKIGRRYGFPTESSK